MTMLLVLLSLISSLFLMLNHPLSLVLLLVALTLCIMLTLLNLLNLSWLAMIMFLIFLGGLLIIFTYLSALIPNEIYFFNILWLMLIFNPLFTLNFWETKNVSTQNTSIPSMMSLNETSNIYFFMLYLLMALMVTMVMTQKMKTPLNQGAY